MSYPISHHTHYVCALYPCHCCKPFVPAPVLTAHMHHCPPLLSHTHTQALHLYHTRCCLNPMDTWFILPHLEDVCVCCVSSHVVGLFALVMHYSCLTLGLTTHSGVQYASNESAQVNLC